MSDLDEYDFGGDTFNDEDENLEADNDEDVVDIDTVTTETKGQIVYRGNDRTSINIMTKYEKARLIATRADQIQNGSPVLVKTTSHEAIEIAEQELRAGVLPIAIKRNMPDGSVEIWQVTELRLPID
jgi:DNA-directed RNA polymerase I, II, and III subunit RPABC2